MGGKPLGVPARSLCRSPLAFLGDERAYFVAALVVLSDVFSLGWDILLCHCFSSSLWRIQSVFFFLFPCWYWVLSARYHHTVARHTFGCTRCFSLIAAWPECVFFLAYLLEHVCVHMVYLESPGTRLSVLVVLVGSILVRPEGLACDGAKASSGRFGDIYPRRGRRGYGFARVPYFCIFRELSLRPRWTAVAALRLRKISSLCMVRLYQVCIDI